MCLLLGGMTKASHAGCPSSMDALVAFDEDTLIAGSQDGLIRLLHIHPDKVLGALPDPDELPIEGLALSGKQASLEPGIVCSRDSPPKIKLKYNVVLVLGALPDPNELPSEGLARSGKQASAHLSWLGLALVRF